MFAFVRSPVPRSYSFSTLAALPAERVSNAYRSILTVLSVVECNLHSERLADMVRPLRGSRTVNVVLASVESAKIEPPCASVISRQM